MYTHSVHKNQKHKSKIKNEMKWKTLGERTAEVIKSNNQTGK